MMNQQYLAPYVNFQGRAREAMEFYQGVLGGELKLHTLDQQGQPKEAGPGDRVTYGRLEANGLVMIGSDGHPDYPPKVGENLAIAVGGTDRDRLTKVFEGLAADGGHLKGQMSDQPWGATVGWLADKFGINWVVSIEQ
jgi:PhnB protein